eukprot:Pgem_evm1s576
MKNNKIMQEPNEKHKKNNASLLPKLKKSKDTNKTKEQCEFPGCDKVYSSLQAC